MSISVASWISGTTDLKILHALKQAEQLARLCVSIQMRPARVARSAIVVQPSTVLQFHRALVQRKYRLLFSPNRRSSPGPKGPQKELIEAIVEMKRRNPSWGCPRIAQQIILAFDVSINKDVVRRILAAHYHPFADGNGPSWLTLIGHAKDSLWSLDLFRCESATLRTHWVLVVMDQFTRRIIGFGVHPGIVDGVALCRMFNRAIRGTALPKYLSSAHDPLYRFHQRQANLRVLEVKGSRLCHTRPYHIRL
jgi:putative transposase